MKKCPQAADRAEVCPDTPEEAARLATELGDDDEQTRPDLPDWLPETAAGNAHLEDRVVDEVQRWRPRALVALFVGNIFLLSPVLLDDLGLLPGAVSSPDKLALFAVPASLLWLGLVQFSARNLFLAHASLLPFYVVVGVDLFLITRYGTRLTSSMLAVLLQNSSDAGAYLREHRREVTVAVLGVVGLWALALWGLRGVRVNGGRPVQVFFGGSLLVLYGALFVRQATTHGGALSGIVDVVSHDRNSPFGIIPQGIVAASVNAAVAEHARAVSSVRFGAVRDVDAAPAVVVLVIGESARPDRFGLYDPVRATTPRLQGTPGLTVFRDVLTQAALTQLAVPLMLTRGTLHQLDSVMERKTVLSAVAEAGFKTAWYSTQQRDQWTGAVNVCSAEAHEQRFFDRRHDDVLVAALNDRLDRRAKDESLFVVLHTQGSHFTFTDRYPAEAQVFATEGDGLTERERLWNAYDNTIAFTDRVVADVIGVLEAHGGDALMLYVADHGENLRDDDRNLFGHFIGNEYDLRVPMFLWTSSSYADRYPHKLAAAQENARLPLSTQTIFATLLQATDVIVDDIPDDEGVLSAEFRVRPRQVLQGFVPVDADSVVPRIRRESAASGMPAGERRRRRPIAETADGP
jgi:glucan phosphoethanolaminetransferase (alkaline phosphatase superfamily)